MRLRLPMEWKGRLTRPKDIDRLPAKLRKGVRKNRWTPLKTAILAKQGDGHWYRVVPTSAWSEEKIKTAWNACQKWKHYKGFSAEMLTIIPTKMDGICFKWTYDPKFTRIETAVVQRRNRLLSRYRSEAVSSSCPH